MLVNRKLISQIVSHSATLEERIQFHQQSGPQNMVPQYKVPDDALFKAWGEALGGSENLERRLFFDGIHISSASKLLTEIAILPEQELPEWALLLDEVIEACQEAEKRPGIFDEHLEGSGINLPFQHLLTPFLTVAQKRYTETRQGSQALISKSVFQNLENSLLKRLSAISERTLFLEFKLRQIKAKPWLILETVAQTSTCLSDDDYRSFVLETLNDKYASLFSKYPCLSRLLAITTLFWIEGVVQFLTRFEADRHRLSAQFVSDSNNDLGVLARVDMDLSDPHSRGRTVLKLSFESGFRLIYKPRDISIELSFAGLIKWLNQEGSPLELYAPNAIGCEHYGWVEHIEHTGCEFEECIETYYHRAGALLAVIYALRGTDYHNENLIAHADYPVPIDQELLFQADLQTVAGYAQLFTQEAFRSSVLSTGLLPAWRITPKGSVIDVSALGGMARKLLSTSVWENINTDAMQVKSEEVEIETHLLTNLPLLRGSVVDPRGHVELISLGFQEMYAFLQSRKNEILSRNGPLEWFKGRLIRVVFRNTRLYFALLDVLYDPKYLRDGASRSIQFEKLYRPLLVGDERSHLWPIIKEEIAALEQADIPYFRHETTSAGILLSNKAPVETAFVRTGYELVSERVRSLNDQDRTIQSEYLKAAFLLPGIGKPHSEDQARSRNLPPVVFEGSLTKEDLFHEAVRIARGVADLAIRNQSAATWISAVLDSKGLYQLVPTGADLYSGNCGMALFLGAASSASNDQNLRSLSLEALHQVREQVRRPLPRTQLVTQLGIGGATGIGSIIYTLTKLARLLKEPELLEEAHILTTLLNEEVIRKDNSYDVVSGTAGALLGLMSFFEETNLQEVLARMIVCGQHLVERQVTISDGQGAWPTLNGQFLTGFSHGNAGIAYSLVRLHKIHADPAFLAAADSAITYENGRYSNTYRNWPDLRQNEHSEYLTNWCHGAAGIGLARLGISENNPSSMVTVDINKAITITLEEGLSSLDHICCGNLGRVEFLLVAGERLARADLLEKATLWASVIVNQAKEKEGYLLNPDIQQPTVFPGFFQGLSGIGYQLLRLSSPGRFPSILLWE